MLVWSFDYKTLKTRAMIAERSDYKQRSCLKQTNGKFTIPGLSRAHLYHPLSLACIGLADFVFYFDFLIESESRKIGDIEEATGQGFWVDQQEKQDMDKQESKQTPAQAETVHNTTPNSSSNASEPTATDKSEIDIDILTAAQRNIAMILGTFANLWKSVGIATSIAETLEDKEDIWLAQLECYKPDSLWSEHHKDGARSFKEATGVLKWRIKTIQQSGTAIDSRAEAQSTVVSALLVRVDNRMSHKLAQASRDVAESQTEIAQANNRIAAATKKDSSDMKVIAIMTMAFLPATFFAALFAVPSLDWVHPGQPIIRKSFWIYWVFTIPTTIVVFALWVAFNQQTIFEGEKFQKFLKFASRFQKKNKKEKNGDEESNGEKMGPMKNEERNGTVIEGEDVKT